MKVTLSTAGRVLALLLIYTLFTTQAALAQFSTQPNGAGDPEADAQRLLLHARTVFVTLDGSDSHFPRTPLDSEQTFIQSLVQWGRYQLAPDAQHADVVLRLRPSVHVSVVDSTDNTGSSIYYTPYYRLTVTEPATLKPLWSITVPVQTGTRKKDHADRFVLSAQNLTSQLKLLVGETLTPTEVANINDVERPHNGHAALIVLGVTLGVTAGAAVAMKMAYDHNVQQQQEEACKQNSFFCTNAIPARTGAR